MVALYLFPSLTGASKQVSEGHFLIIVPFIQTLQTFLKTFLFNLIFSPFLFSSTHDRNIYTNIFYLFLDIVFDYIHNWDNKSFFSFSTSNKIIVCECVFVKGFYKNISNYFWRKRLIRIEVLSSIKHYATELSRIKTLVNCYVWRSILTQNEWRSKVLFYFNVRVIVRVVL